MLRIFITFYILNRVVLSFFLSYLRMQSLQEILALQRIINDLIVKFRGFFIFIKQEVITFWLPSINYIILKFIFIHICLLILEVIFFILVLIILQYLFQLLDVWSWFSYQNACLGFLCLGFAINVTIKYSINESSHFRIVSQIHIAHSQNWSLYLWTRQLGVTQNFEFHWFYKLHLFILFSFFFLLIVKIDVVIIAPQVFEAIIAGSFEITKSLFLRCFPFFGLAEL